MFEYVGINLGLCWPQLGVAPILMAEGVTLEEAALVFQDPILVALVSGVMMAFAFQLLTNFSVAFGISSRSESIRF